MRRLLPVATAVVSAATAAEASIGLLRLPDVAACLAADWLAETASLEELLLTGGEREALSAILAGQFLVFGH